MKKLNEFNFFELKLVKKSIDFSKNNTFYGLQKASIYNVVKHFWLGIKRNSLNTRATSLSYKFLLAIFPMIIFVFSLIPYFPVENFEANIIQNLENVLPKSAYLLAVETIHDLVSHKRDGLISFSFLFMIYLANEGASAMIGAFNESALIHKKMNFIQLRLVSLVVLILLFITTTLSAVAIIFSDTIIKYLLSFELLNNQLILWALEIGKIAVLTTIFLVAISAIYKISSKQRLNLKFFSTGAFVAVIMNLAISYGFAYYINHFSSYNKVFGSIGTLMIIMIWLYLNAFSLLLGFELNAAISKAKNKLH